MDGAAKIILHEVNQTTKYKYGIYFLIHSVNIKAFDMCALIHITTETGYRVRKEGGGENHPKNLKIITSSGET